MQIEPPTISANSSRLHLFVYDSECSFAPSISRPFLIEIVVILLTLVIYEYVITRMD